MLVAAIGRPGMVRAEHVKPGAVVVDVGINRVSDPLLARELLEPGALRRVRAARLRARRRRARAAGGGGGRGAHARAGRRGPADDRDADVEHRAARPRPPLRRAVLRVGLTGGIACGKSHVLRRLAARGCRTLDLDAVGAGGDGARQPGARSRSRRPFGAGVLDSRRLARPGRARRAGVRGRAKRGRGSTRIVHPRVRAAEAALGRGLRGPAGRGAGHRRGAPDRERRPPAFRPAGGRALRRPRCSCGGCARATGSTSARRGPGSRRSCPPPRSAPSRTSRSTRRGRPGRRIARPTRWPATLACARRSGREPSAARRSSGSSAGSFTGPTTGRGAVAGASACRRPRPQAGSRWKRSPGAWSRPPAGPWYRAADAAPRGRARVPPGRGARCVGVAPRGPRPGVRRGGGGVRRAAHPRRPGSARRRVSRGARRARAGRRCHGRAGCPGARGPRALGARRPLRGRRAHADGSTPSGRPSSGSRRTPHRRARAARAWAATARPRRRSPGSAARSRSRGRCLALGARRDPSRS